MSKISRITLGLLLIILSGSASSCSILPEGIRQIFISPTPTSTNTPTSTATSTSTPTATATPMPDINLFPCAFTSDCPEAIPLVEILGHDAVTTMSNTVEISYDQTVRLGMGWVAFDDVILKDNIEHFTWVFTVDGQDYFQKVWLEEGVTQDQYPGVWFGVNMSGWKIGEPHIIRIGFIIEEQISDGWSTFDAGYTNIYTYYVMPQDLPTATPTATITLTPKPRPTAIPYTKTPAFTATPSCSTNANISIDNTTGGTLTLYLKGPASYKFTLGGGVTVLSVCSGSYSYTAYGCGGASDTGTINSGESHEFYCQ